MYAFPSPKPLVRFIYVSRFRTRQGANTHYWPEDESYQTPKSGQVGPNEAFAIVDVPFEPTLTIGWLGF
jgi:hypothetical protein